MIDSIFAGPCPDCGAHRGEPCFPDCLSAAIEQEILAEQLDRDEDHDPSGELADAAEDRMFGGDR